MKPKLLVMVALFATAAFADRILWNGGEWDDSGRPAGALLTDDCGWYGEAVFTGMRDQRTALGLVCDFNRICEFDEIDVIGRPGASGSIAFSVDGETWSQGVRFAATGQVCRVRFAEPRTARFVRVANPGVTRRNLAAWGSCATAPEPPRIALGDALKMSTRRDGTIALYAVPDPADQLGSEPRLPMPADAPVERLALTMAKGEIETRYFTLVNETAEPAVVALAAEVSDRRSELEAEWRIAGLVRTDPPTRKLSEKELFDMLLTEQKATSELPAGKLSFRPFFTAAEKPDRRFLLKHVANADQVIGFPTSVPLKPGEGALLMLRLRTARTADAKALPRRTVRLHVAEREIPCEVTIADIALSERKPWVYAWSPFTRQWPYETVERTVADAKAMLELGVTHYSRIPEVGTRARYVMEHEPQSTFATLVTDKAIFHRVYNGQSAFTDADYQVISNELEHTLARVRSAVLPLERFAVELPDEPHEGNALGIGRMAKLVKELHPELNVFSDPSFWTKRGCFADAETIVRHLEWFYNDCVDISVPYRSNMEDAVKRERLFCRPRKVNAQYAHPARRAGRSIAWSSFRYGLDGFAFWAYYTPRGDPWDIRTWTLYDFDQAEMVFPLERGVAITWLYENMREAVEDYRLLTAVREAGKTAELEAIVAEFAASFRPAAAETSRPYDCDFLALRQKLLNLFVKP